MPTVKLVASTYSVTGSVTVANPDNMYTDVSSTTYATLTHTTSGTTSYYCYIKGFNFNDIPANAEVSSFTIRIRGYESNSATSSYYAPCLVNGTSSISGAVASSNFGSSASTITIPFTGTWATLKGYGSNLGIRVTVRRSNKNKQCYIYIYGAEIEVTYTIPVATHTVSITGTNVSPSGSQTVNEGDNLTITMSGRSAKPTVTDNSVDVSSQLVQSGTTYTYTITNIVADHAIVVSENHIISITGTNVTPSGTQIVSDGSSLTVTMPDRENKPTVTDNGVDVTSQVVVGSSSTSSVSSHPIDSETDYWYVYDVENSYTDSTSTTYARYSMAPNNTNHITYSFGELDVPDDEQITVSCSLKTGRNNNGIISSTTAQLYSGETPKGTAATAIIGTKTISGGSWTSAELADVRLVITAISGNYSANNPGDYAYLYVYGATLTATYPNGYNYTYTLTNITTDHTIIVVDSGGGGATLYFKNNGSWVAATAVYKKVSGSWVLQSDLSNVFDSQTNYVKGN